MLESGQSVADYRILEPLAENQVFQSYLVTGAQQERARLLLLAHGVLADNNARQVFRERAEQLLGQSFPGLCTLQDAATSGGESYCLYPEPSGTSLAEQPVACPTARAALETIRQLALLLEPAHAAGIWHGNLAPATIYLDGQGGVQLADVAFSSLVKLDLHAGADPCYTSPEGVRGESLGPAADLYSLGILLHQLLTGKPPFTGSEPFAIAMQHLQGEAPTLPASLAVLQPLLDGLLQSLPDRRTSAAELVVALDELLSRPELDGLQLVSAVEPSTEPEPDPSKKPPRAAPFEKALLGVDDMSRRIEERLKERAEALQRSAVSTASERANSARMAAISRTKPNDRRPMQSASIQGKKAGNRRFLLLAGFGVALGAAFYLLFFAAPPAQRQAQDEKVPAALLTDLDAGNRQLQAADYPGAEKTFQALIKRYPAYPHPYNNLAAVYASQGDLEQARQALESALATDEAYSRVYRNLGTVYAEMARDSYGRALHLDKGELVVNLQLFAAAGGEALAIKTSPSVAEPVTVATAPQPPAPAPLPAEPAGKVPPVAASAPAAPAEPVLAAPAAVVAAVLAPTPDEEPVREQVLAPQPENPEIFLERWAQAWSAQDVEAYLNAYGKDFEPADGKSRDAWEKSRRSRLTNPEQIQVSLQDFAVLRKAQGRVQIEVTQDYKSDRYSDRTRKKFDLQLDDGRWRIVRERSLGRLR